MKGDGGENKNKAGSCKISSNHSEVTPATYILAELKFGECHCLT